MLIFAWLALSYASKRTSDFLEQDTSKRLRTHEPPPRPYAGLFGKERPLPIVLDAMGIMQPPTELCLKDSFGCYSWRNDSNGGVALKELNDKMAAMGEGWLSELPPKRENAAFFLALLTPKEEAIPNYISALNTAIAEADDNDPWLPFVTALGGAYVSEQCAKGEESSSIIRNSIIAIRAIIVHNKAPSLSSYFESDLLAGMNTTDLMEMKALHDNEFEVLQDLWRIKTSFLNGSLDRTTALKMITNEPLAASQPWDRAMLLRGLASKEFNRFVDTLAKKFNLELLYALLVDWQEATISHSDPTHLLVKLAPQLLRGHLGLAVLDEGRQQALRINMEAFSLAEELRPLREVCLKHPEIPQQEGIDCSSLLGGVSWEDLTYPELINLARKEKTVEPLNSVYEAQKAALNWYRLHHSHLESYLKHRLVFNSKLWSLPLDADRDVFVLWREAPAANQATEIPIPLINRMPFSSLLDPSGHGKLAILTLRYLSGKLQLEEVIANMPSHYFPIDANTVLGLFGDHLLSLLSPQQGKRFQGGFSHQPAALLLDTLRTLHLNPPLDCPQGVRSGVREALRLLLVFHLASHQAFKEEGGLLHDLLIRDMEVGDSLLLPALGCNHAMSYLIEKQGMDSYRLILFNSGLGVNEHERDSKGNFVPFRVYPQVSYEALSDRRFFMQPWIPMAKFNENFYGLPSLPQAGLPMAKSSSQRAGTCFAKHLLYWLRFHFGGREAMLWFKTYNFAHHAGTIRVTLGADLTPVATLPPRMLPCRHLLESNPKGLLLPVMRYYALRLWFQLPNEDGDSRARIRRAVADDAPLVACLSHSV